MAYIAKGAEGACSCAPPERILIFEGEGTEFKEAVFTSLYAYCNTAIESENMIFGQIKLIDLLIFVHNMAEFQIQVQRFHIF